MGGWKRGNDNVPHSDHPERPPLGDVARTAVQAAGGDLQTLYRLRWDDGRERVAIYLRGIYAGDRAIASGMFEREIPEYTCLSSLVDLRTGEWFGILSCERDVAARKLKVTDLPADVLAKWPRDDRDRPVSAGIRENPTKQEVFKAAFKAMVADDGAVTSDPGVAAADQGRQLVLF